jgi:hypothetical protein
MHAVIDSATGEGRRGRLGKTSFESMQTRL